MAKQGGKEQHGHYFYQNGRIIWQMGNQFIRGELGTLVKNGVSNLVSGLTSGLKAQEEFNESAKTITA